MADGMYSTKETADLSGATLRQLDYWDRTGIISVAVPAQGSGSRRRWSRSNVEAARALALLSESVLFQSGHDVMCKLADDVATSPGVTIMVPLAKGLFLTYDPALARVPEMHDD